ncbi:unnamed protein product [Didymodactylos carnosus]|uniref:Uncharacterized protein n=1 Tax=Didymodactylos carnosus TaxID=1234261 RepID=A0A8S2DKI7_9BILA|nr:unnamed protein product [Didymodactylos carnosus]CAF3708620.1 unnamed protein product [Didymodactylos carnosus]
MKHKSVVFTQQDFTALTPHNPNRHKVINLLIQKGLLRFGDYFAKQNKTGVSLKKGYLKCFPKTSSRAENEEFELILQQYVNRQLLRQI